MKNKIVILLCILILISQFYLIFRISFEREDVNRDGKVNSLDLLIVQKKILEERESDK